MEDRMQTAEEAGPSSPIRARPVPLGYLRVLSQGELEERVYTIAEGETTIGRGSGCEVCIDAKSLSRKHTIILVEDGYHFIQDLGSRNKTYRKSLLLRPHTFYELTHDCELTLADVQCQYYIGTPPECYCPPDPEQTATYDFEDDGAALNSEKTARSSSVTVKVAPDSKESATLEQTALMSEGLEGAELDVRAKLGDRSRGTTTSSAELTKANASVAEKSKPEVPEQTVLYTAVDSEGSTVGEEEGEKEEGGGAKGGMEGGDPTQAYLCDEGGEEDKLMEYEATVAYNVGDLDQSDDSAASSPLLAGGGCEATQFYPAAEDPESPPLSPPRPKEKKKRVCFDSAVKNGSEDSIDGAPSSSSRPGPSSSSDSKKVHFEQTVLLTDPDEATQPYEQTEDTTLGSDTEDRGASEMGVDQTVAYNVEGSDEEDGAPNKTCTARNNMEVEQTVAYNLEENREDSIAAENRAAGRDNVEPTVPYLLEETEEDDTEETAPTHTSKVAKSGGASETGPEDVPVSAETHRESASESSYCQSMSKMETSEDGEKTENDGVEAGSQSSSDFDFSENIPKLSDGGKHSKQKTLFASRQRGRGKRGGRGRASSGASETSRLLQVKPEDTASTGTMEIKGKSKKGASAKSKAAAVPAEPSTSGILSGDTGSVSVNKNSVVKDKPATRQRRGRGSRSKTLTSAESSAIVATDTSTLIEPVSSPSYATSEGKNEDTKAAPGAAHVGDVELRVSKTSPTSSKSDGASSIASSKCDNRDTISKPATATSIDADMLSDESPDISLHSDHSSVASSATTPVMKDPLASSNGSSVASSTSSRGGRGGRKRGGGRGRASPRKGKAAKPALKSEASSTLRHKLAPEKLSDPLHRVMFTGVVDKDGERTVRQLGGELVDSVYQCTHLVTDKVRRTVKFLCCLSRGCQIVSTDWLDQCRALKKFLPADPFTIKDRAAERQHGFSLSRSCDRAKLTRVLAGYKVFLTLNVKPVKKDMADIIKCSGGEVLSALPHTPEEGVIIVTCENDLSMCSEAMRAGVPVHSTELILGGVLKQELDFHSHVMSGESSSSGSSSSTTTPSRKRKGKEPASSQPSAKRRKKGT